MADFWDTYIDSLDAPPSGPVRAVASAHSAGRTVKSALLRDVPVAAQGVVDLAQRPVQRAEILREMGIDPVEYARQAVRDPVVEAEVDRRLAALSDTGALAEKIDTAYGFTPREAQTPGERIASDAIVGGTLGLATAPLGGGVLPAIVSGAAGGAGGGAARELGLSDEAQFVAGVAAGASPAAIARGPVSGPLLRGVARRATGAAAREAIDEASVLFRKVAGVSDQEIAAAAAAERSAGTGDASLAQMLRSDSATAAEGRTAAANPQFAQTLLEQRGSNADALRKAESDLYAGGTDPGAGLLSARAQSKAGVDSAYRAARQSAQGAPPVSVANTNAAAAAITDENAAFLRSRIPAETGEVLTRFESGSGSLADLDNLSRSLSQTLKDLSRAGDDQGVRLASQLKRAVDADFQAAAGTNPAAQKFLDAKAAQAAHADLFSLDHPSVSALLERTGVGNAIRARENPQLLANLRRNPAEAFRLRRALQGDPAALEGAQRLALNDLLGGKPIVSEAGGSPGVNIHTVIREAEKPATAAALRGLLEDTGYESLMTMLRRTRQLTTLGAKVTPRQAYRTIATRAASDGSALAVIVADAAVGLKAPVARGAVRGTLHALGWPRRFYDGTTAAQRTALVEKAMLGDLDTVDLLLARPRSQAQITQWNQKLETALFALDTGRAAVRTELQQAPYRGPEETQR